MTPKEIEAAFETLTADQAVRLVLATGGILVITRGGGGLAYHLEDPPSDPPAGSPPGAYQWHSGAG